MCFRRMHLRELVRQRAVEKKKIFLNVDMPPPQPSRLDVARHLAKFAQPTPSSPEPTLLPWLLQKLFGVPLIGGQDAEAFAKIDMNGDGVITRMEWNAGFDMFDTNRDGVISPTEFSAGITSAEQQHQAQSAPPMLIGSEQSRMQRDQLVDAFITGRGPGDTGYSSAKHRRFGLLDAVRQLSSNQPCRFNSSYTPRALVQQAGGGGGGWAQGGRGGATLKAADAGIPCSPLMLLTNTLAAYPLFVAHEFPVWDLEHPWSADMARAMFEDEYAARTYTHMLFDGHETSRCLNV